MKLTVKKKKRDAMQCILCPNCRNFVVSNGDSSHILGPSSPVTHMYRGLRLPHFQGSHMGTSLCFQSELLF